ncbi:MAG TPA: hypothetical protein VHS81_13995 [Caulobacteraceae bacterium]|jgi:hypothetical protein|nr:hypothetical protein [Caulobacteraceae bacterium]
MSNPDLLPRPMTLDEFTPMVGQVLLADCNPKPVELKLVEAAPLPNLSKVERHPFILIFRSPPEILLVTGIYAMRCGEWGPDLIYIEETGSPDPQDKGHFYQAVFN